jgi:hypothetical protein
VEQSAPTCPFCGAAFVAASLPVPPAGVRSAAIAAATAVAIAAGACSSSQPNSQVEYGPADFDATFEQAAGPDVSVADGTEPGDAAQEAAPTPDASADASADGALDGGTD